MKITMVAVSELDAGYEISLAHYLFTEGSDSFLQILNYMVQVFDGEFTTPAQRESESYARKIQPTINALRSSPHHMDLERVLNKLAEAYKHFESNSSYTYQLYVEVKVFDTESLTSAVRL